MVKLLETNRKRYILLRLGLPGAAPTHPNLREPTTFRTKNQETNYQSSGRPAAHVPDHRTGVPPEPCVVEELQVPQEPSPGRS